MSGDDSKYLPTQLFYFYSALSTADQALGLCLDPGTNDVVLMPWRGGRAEELWVLVNQGGTFALQNASSITTDQPLYLALSANKVTVTAGTWGWFIPPAWNNTSANILPDYQVMGAIETDDGTMAVAVSNGDRSPGTPLIAAPPDGSPAQTWAVFPASMLPSRQSVWKRFASKLVDREHNTLVLDVGPRNFSTGHTPLILNKIVNGATSQFWQSSPDSYILSGIGGTNMIQTRDAIPGGGYVAGVGGWNEKTARWSLDEETGLITSSDYPGLVLSADGAYANSTLSFVVPQSDPTDGMRFTTDPAPILTRILAQAPVQFPPFDSGDEAIAFQSINEQLGYTNVRMQYLNTHLSLTAERIGRCVMPQSLQSNPAAWTAVVSQLQNEVDYVHDVDTFLQSYSDFTARAQTEQGDILTRLIGDAGIAEGTDTSGVATVIFTDILFALISAIPEVGPPLADIGQTALGAAAAVKRTSVTPFEVAVSQLWTTLSEMYSSIDAQLAYIQTALVSDWGKLQAMKTALAGPLAGSSVLSADQMNAVNEAFTVAAMQILLPAKYQIYTYQEDNDDGVPGMDDYKYAQHIVDLPGDMWQKSWIAERTDWSSYPTQTALQKDVFDITGQNWFSDMTAPWPFPVCWAYKWADASVHTAVLTVTNQTARMLHIAPGNNIQPVLLPPFASASVNLPAGAYGVSADVAVTDLGGKTVASFTVKMDVPPSEGVTPRTSKLSATPGYALSAPQCSQGAWQAFRDGYPGTVQVTVSGGASK